MQKKYADVYKRIREDITTGAIAYKDKLPSKRVAAENFGVSVITVEHAYEILESEGYVEAKARSGYFSCYLPNGVLTKKEYPFSQTVVSTENYHNDEAFPFSVYASAVRSVLNDYGENIAAKTDGSGSLTLKTAIKRYLKTSRNIITNEKNIIIGSGAEYLYSIIAKLIGEGKTCAIETPSYGLIEKVYNDNGLKTVKMRLGHDGILTKDLNDGYADVLHVTPYRSFPSGVTASASKKAEYLNFAKKNHSYIVEDDYESEFSLSATLTETLFGNTPDDNVIYVNTFSKTVFPSVRLAYMILPQTLVDKYYTRFGDYSCTVPALDQYVTAKILNDGSFAGHINRVRRKRKKRRTGVE